MTFKNRKQQCAVMAKLKRKPLFIATAHWKNGTTHMVVQKMKNNRYRVIDVCQEEITKPAEIVNYKFKTLPEAKNFAIGYKQILEEQQ